MISPDVEFVFIAFPAVIVVAFDVIAVVVAVAVDAVVNAKI